MQTTPYPPRPLTDQELGWVAGLYEGEGYAVLAVTRYKHGDDILASGCRVGLGMTDCDVVDRLNKLFPAPGGVRVRQRREKHWKTYYEWQISRREHVSAFLLCVMPLLGERRRARAEEVLAFAQTKGRQKTPFCPNGHRYTDDNIYLKPDSRVVDGHIRMCKICRKEGWRRDRERAAARRAAKTDS